MSPPPPAAESTIPAKPVMQIRKSSMGPLTVISPIKCFPSRFCLPLQPQPALTGQHLVQDHPAHLRTVYHGGVSVVFNDVVKIFIHQNDDVLPVGGVDDAAVVA